MIVEALIADAAAMLMLGVSAARRRLNDSINYFHDRRPKRLPIIDDRLRKEVGRPLTGKDLLARRLAGLAVKAIRNLSQYKAFEYLVELKLREVLKGGKKCELQRHSSH